MPTEKSSKNKKIVKTPDGEIVDTETGIVLGYEVREDPEWRAYTPEEEASRNRVGPPLTQMLHDQGLHTEISRVDSRLNPKQREQVFRLKKWQSRIRVSDGKDRSLSYALNEITKTGSQLNLPKNILETAGNIARRAIKEKSISRGRSIKSLADGCIGVACKQHGAHRKIREIADASYEGKDSLDVWRKDVRRSERLIIEKLDYRYKPEALASTNAIPIDKPEDYVKKLSVHLNLSASSEGVIYDILAVAKDSKLYSGRGPIGLTGAAAYIASIINNESRNQREIAEIADVTEVTIRNRYKELNEKLMFDIKL